MKVLDCNSMFDEFFNYAYNYKTIWVKSPILVEMTDILRIRYRQMIKENCKNNILRNARK